MRIGCAVAMMYGTMLAGCVHQTRAVPTPTAIETPGRAPAPPPVTTQPATDSFRPWTLTDNRAREFVSPDGRLRIRMTASNWDLQGRANYQRLKDGHPIGSYELPFAIDKGALDAEGALYGIAYEGGVTGFPSRGQDRNAESDLYVYAVEPTGEVRWKTTKVRGSPGYGSTPVCPAWPYATAVVFHPGCNLVDIHANVKYRESQRWRFDAKSGIQGPTARIDAADTLVSQNCYELAPISVGSSDWTILCMARPIARKGVMGWMIVYGVVNGLGELVGDWKRDVSPTFSREQFEKHVDDLREYNRASTCQRVLVMLPVGPDDAYQVVRRYP